MANLQSRRIALVVLAGSDDRASRFQAALIAPLLRTNLAEATGAMANTARRLGGSQQCPSRRDTQGQAESRTAAGATLYLYRVQSSPLQIAPPRTQPSSFNELCDCNET